ncbi:MAG: transposase [Okeania sp. SIO3C4]|nr:transposase [Okeania sp. SIO3C4]
MIKKKINYRTLNLSILSPYSLLPTPYAWRTFDCPHCGMRIDRDLNAALVLSQYGEINQNARG